MLSFFNPLESGEILVPPKRTKELGDGIDLGPQVLYHPDGTWILEVPPKLELPILEAFTASLVPGLTILMTEATEGDVHTSSEEDYLDDESFRRERIGKQNGKTPRNNQKQNEQTKKVAKKLGLTKEQSQELHQAISHKGFCCKELLDFAKNIFNK